MDDVWINFVEQIEVMKVARHNLSCTHRGLIAMGGSRITFVIHADSVVEDPRIYLLDYFFRDAKLLSCVSNMHNNMISALDGILLRQLIIPPI